MILQIILFLLIAVSAAGFRTVYALQGKLWLVLNDKASAVSARALHFVDDRLSRVYTACRLGTSVFFIGAAWFLGVFFLDPSPKQIALYIFCLWGGLILIREVFPKLFLLSAKKSLRVLVVPAIGLYYLFYPFIWIKEKLLYLMTGRHSLPVRSVDYLPVEANTVMAILDEEMIDEESGVNAELLENALEFKSVRVRDCMVPRTEITAVEKKTDIKNIRKLFSESGHSKIFVFDTNIDGIVGYCRVGDLFRKPENIDEILLPVLHVSENMPAKELMLQLTEEHKSMAVVSDEYGGTAGIISMEDIVEEIFGDINDEHDETDKFTEEVLRDGSYLFDADISVDYLNKKYQFEIPEGNYDTLGGYIIAVHEDIPKEGAELQIDKFRCSILSMEGTRISKVRLYM